MSLAMKILYFFLIAFTTDGESHPLDNLIDEIQSDSIDLSPLGVMLFSEPDESVGKAVNDWTPDDGQNPEELGSYVEGDMLIPTVEGRNGLVKTSSRWENGIVPFVFASNVGKNGAAKFLFKTELVSSQEAPTVR